MQDNALCNIILSNSLHWFPFVKNNKNCMRRSLEIIYTLKSKLAYARINSTR